MAWGNNSAGQLGDDSIESHMLPVKVLEPMSWKIWLWIWKQIKGIPDKVAAIQKLFAEPKLPPLPPMPEAPK